ncbi:MAG: hypothetical protein ACRD4U_09350 [Candidatus Acidiferrales bacterium]
MKALLSLATILSCLSSLGLAGALNYELAARVETQGGAEQRNEEVLTPLTDAERSLDLRELILDQPDFVADLDYFASEKFGAHGFSEHIARKGSRYREESEFWIFVGEIGKSPARLYPQDKVYNELLPPRTGSVGGDAFDVKALALDSNVTFTALGTVEIDGHKCLKIEAARTGRPEKVYLYVARELRNLVLVAQVIEPKRSMVQRLRNVSFEVPDSLVEIPPDYKPIEHDRWTKVESATVKYGDRPSRDFGVFRAPGGEFFIWVNDAHYPWHYLYRPQQGTVEIAFQGLLVNRTGAYIWQTKETEAFSLTHYRRPRGAPIDARSEVKPNSIKFRSNSYGVDKAMIEISW